MVCTADELLEWEDFPKGLRVLLLDRDVNYASEIRSKLEGMDYIVSTFCNEDEALSAVLSNSEVFHVAIVEVSTVKCDGSFKFLQKVKGLPIVMTASVQCLTTTMKCIALGAIEVLNKPICEDKLRNIWQHVVHKAYSAVAESPRQESTVPMVKDEDIRDKLLGEMPCLSDGVCNDEPDRSSGDDKYPAPSTPQLKQVRLLDDAGCHDQTNWSSEKDSVAHYEESKSVETTSCNAALNMPLEAGEQMHESVVKEENNSADGCKSESDTSPRQKNEAETSSLGGNTRKQTKVSESRSPCGAKNNQKKMKVDWTSDLHKKFVQAVEQLGGYQAIPSRILELMKVEGLTRHNVASHLQKYRMHRRHALPKREERRISACPVWATPGSHTAGLHAWGPPYQIWPWKTCAAMQADAWGCPVMPPLHGSYSYYPQNGYNGGADISRNSMPPNSHNDHHLADEVVDQIVKEAISKPWLPLPLGLKPPSTESVLSELSKQGISSIPPPSQ